MARTKKLPRITPEFLAAELADIREHLAVLKRHAVWLESEVTAIRAGQDPNVRPIRGDGPRPDTGA